MSRHDTTVLDLARDELFSHIHRCGVMRATPEKQAEWLADTADYLADRFPALTPTELAELQTIGERFCGPVIEHGAENTALSLDEQQDAEQDAETGAMAGV